MRSAWLFLGKAAFWAHLKLYLEGYPTHTASLPEPRPPREESRDICLPSLWLKHYPYQSGLSSKQRTYPKKVTEESLLERDGWSRGKLNSNGEAPWAGQELEAAVALTHGRQGEGSRSQQGLELWPSGKE